MDVERWVTTVKEDRKGGEKVIELEWENKYFI